MYTYTARILGKNDTPPPEAKRGSLRIGVFRVEDNQETEVGEYLQHFNSLTPVFCPFRLNDRDYALYSIYGHSTGVMELPACKDLPLAASASGDFVVSEYYVPAYMLREHKFPDGRINRSRVNSPTPENFETKTGTSGTSYPVTPLLYYPFAFVAGYMQQEHEPNLLYFIDLSRMDEGILQMDNRFGRVFIDENTPLSALIDMSNYLWDADDDDSDSNVDIRIIQRFDIRTGKRVPTLREGYE